MQTRKKVLERKSREVASPRVSRLQKKLVETVKVQAKKVTELITSSARKTKVVGSVSKAIEEPASGTNFDSKFRVVNFDDSRVHLGFDDEHEFGGSWVHNKGSDNGTSDCVTDTIFSPSFQVGRSIGGELSSGDFYAFFQHGSQQIEGCGQESLQIDCHDGGVTLSPEVSVIYLSMKNSNLECDDEKNQDHLSAGVCQEDEDGEDYDDFDPYFFIKNLPSLSSIVPTFRPVLLPKQTRSCPSTTLVLDLDETLVHSSLEFCEDADFTFSVKFNLMEHSVYVRCRPHLKEFLERVSKLFEVIIFTASQSIYAQQLLNVLDPKRKIFRHRVYRDSCVFIDGNYLKDLSVLGRDLTRVMIVDNSPQAFGFQVENGIPIESWFDDQSDTELLLLLPFLESLIGAEDVRPLIAKKYNLQEKISAAGCPVYNVGDPFYR